MKIGDRVVFVNNKDVNNSKLTIGKVYRVVNLESNYSELNLESNEFGYIKSPLLDPLICVINDNGEEEEYYIWRFKLLKEIREKKLLKLCHGNQFDIVA